MEIMKYKCSYEGDLKNIQDPIVYKMLERQVEQGNKKDVSVFEADWDAYKQEGGFNWADTPEGFQFWQSVLRYGNYNKFYERYPELAETTQEAHVSVSIQNDELMDLLNRIESKLDQLLTEKGQCLVEQAVEISEFNPGDRVRVKSWKEIKAMTTKDEDGDRKFDDGWTFFKYKKVFCGMDGVVMRTLGPWVTTKIDDQEVRLHYKSLEKLNH